MTKLASVEASTGGGRKTQAGAPAPSASDAGAGALPVSETLWATGHTKCFSTPEFPHFLSSIKTVKLIFFFTGTGEHLAVSLALCGISEEYTRFTDFVLPGGVCGCWSRIRHSFLQQIFNFHFSMEKFPHQNH